MSFQEIVFQNLDQAVANGYDFTDWSADDIAYDLCSHFTDIGEVCEENEILPIVKLWLSKKVVPVNWLVEGF